MASIITKKTLEHLAELARIELTDREEEKLLADLQKIVGHFEELEKLAIEDTALMTGGSDLKNIFREDGVRVEHDPQPERGAFPEVHGGFLKVPPVFKRDD